MNILYRKKDQKGFTIVEVLVSVALLAVIGFMMNAMLLNAMRAILKAQSVKEVKQSGDFAMSVILQRLRNALSFTGCSGTSDAITITNHDGTTTTLTTAEIPSGSGQYKIISDTGGTIQILTSSNNVTVNTGNTLQFTCNTTTGTIDVRFVLDHVATANLPFEQRASIPYSSRVVLRNW